MQLIEMLRTAVGALWAHKLRTALSILGIVIGVGSIVAIISLVNGATAQVKQQIAGLGMRTITITLFPQARSSASSARAYWTAWSTTRSRWWTTRTATGPRKTLPGCKQSPHASRSR